MASLIELVERVNKGEMIDPASLEIYQDSANAAEKFLAHHAHALLQLRQSNQNMLQALEAIDFSDQKVLSQFVNVCNFLGQNDLRTLPMIRFGGAAIGRREYALGLEAIQAAVAGDVATGGVHLADRENALQIAQQYDRAGQCVGWNAPTSNANNGKTIRIGYVTGNIVDEDSTARFILSLARNLDSAKFKLHVYSTEANVRRERNPYSTGGFVPASSKRGRQTIEQLKQSKIGFTPAPLDGDLISSARELASAMTRDQIDVAIFDTTLSDAIGSILAGWNVARVKLNLARRAPMLAGQFDGIGYTDAIKLESDRDFWQRRGIEPRAIVEGVDLSELADAAPQRSAYGIPEQSIVLATSGAELDRTIGTEFIDAIINLLRAHPQAVYLVTGDGELSWQKRRFESAGVGKRVGYAGKRKDLPGFLRIADVYLAEFPTASTSGVLHAMSMERPVVAMQWSDAPEHAAAAQLVGEESTIGGRDTNAFIERVSKLMREPAYRAKLGKSMRSRVEQQFAFNQTARQIERWCTEALGGGEQPGANETTTQSAKPTAFAA